MCFPIVITSFIEAVPVVFATAARFMPSLEISPTILLLKVITSAIVVTPLNVISQNTIMSRLSFAGASPFMSRYFSPHKAHEKCFATPFSVVVGNTASTVLWT